MKDGILVTVGVLLILESVAAMFYYRSFKSWYAQVARAGRIVLGVAILVVVLLW